MTVTTEPLDSGARFSEKKRLGASGRLIGAEAI